MGVIIDGISGNYGTISYAPGYVQSGDLEPAVKTVTAVAEAIGLGLADYNVNLTIPAPTDPRLAVTSFAGMLRIDSMVADGNLYYRVYVDVQDADHLLFDGVFLPPLLVENDTTFNAAGFPVAFPLIADGAAHTYYFFLWKDGVGAGAQLDQVELNIGVGIDDTLGMGKCLEISSIRGAVSVSGLVINDYEAGGWPGIMLGIVAPAGGVPVVDDVAYADNLWESMLGAMFGAPPFLFASMILARGVRTFQASGSLGVYLAATFSDGVFVISNLTLHWRDAE